MMRRLSFLLLWLAVPVGAQVPGNCEHGVSEGLLRANDVQARVYGAARLFSRTGEGSQPDPGYIVPNGRECSTFAGPVRCTPLYHISPWISGEIEGEARMALSYYRPTDFWPGPLLDGAHLPNPEDCSDYDRVFVVSRSDIANYLDTGVATEDLMDWPVDWGAPVLDGDGLEGNYNLAGGDQPAILGDQMAWWVVNDVGNEHEASDTEQLGVELQISAFASRDNMPAISESTMYTYRIVNRNRTPIEDMYFGVFADMGSDLHEYLGSDTTRGLAFVFNDASVNQYYGGYPAYGIQIVDGPVGLPNGLDDDHDGVVDEATERLSMTSFMPMFYQYPIGKPGDPEEFYWRLRGRWNDGSAIRAYGLGNQDQGEETTFVWPGDPVTESFWSALNLDGSGSQVQPSYWLFNLAVGPFRLEAGESADIVMGIPFVQSSSWQASIRDLRDASDIIKNAWDIGYFQPEFVSLEQAPADWSLQVSRPSPNPFTNQITIRYELSEPLAVRLAVYDVLGREVAILVESELNEGSHEAVLDGAGLAPGTYVVRFEAAGEQQSFPVVKLQ